MSTYPVDIKVKRITSTVANQEIFAGPARILGFSANCTAGAGTIDLEDDGTSLCSQWRSHSLALVLSGILCTRSSRLVKPRLAYSMQS